MPWAAFGRKPEPGALWGFEVLRFSGKNWASWTAGAAYTHPEKFGYLCFGGGFMAELQRFAAAVRGTKGNEWRLITPAGILEFTNPASSLAAGLAQARQQLAAARLETAGTADSAKRADLLKRLAALDPPVRAAEAALAAGSPDAAGLAALLLRIGTAAKAARELEYEARLEAALEK